jgi:hypothetical protein
MAGLIAGYYLVFIAVLERSYWRFIVPASTIIYNNLNGDSSSKTAVL